MRPVDPSVPLTADADFRFYVGVHHPRLVWPLTLRGFRVCVSANVLRARVCDAPFLGCDAPWLLDSGAFTQVALRGGFDQSPRAYAAMIRCYARTGLIAASTQDYMCERVALRATGLTLARHQALTIDRFDAIRDAGTGGVHLLAVPQGRSPDDYRRHLEAYGGRIGRGAWVGVGSLCKRQGDPAVIAGILDAILHDRPDLRLHGFGCKRTSLLDPEVRRRLATADSMAWSYAARFEGRDQNAWDEAGRFALSVGGCPEAVDHLAARAGWRPAVPRAADGTSRQEGVALWLQ
ncbi:MAG TPA: hypothetical protein VME40_02055 [Caulobacteraceae bacterium]|nr:hypothetical protein [Caulobacteraceae bacterium]